MTLVLEGIGHAYGTKTVLHGIDLTVGAGEIVCLLGPSGDGKTTLLRLVAGLEPLQAGRIAIDGVEVAATGGRATPPEDRAVGFVFQDYALFPHLTVAGNVAFGLRKTPRGDRPWQVAAALARVGLEAFANAYPHTLSGGQQQRVALARALAPGPRVVLLDEAFASLDARLREQVRDDTLHVLQQSGVPALIVTHDAEEAMFLADRIALMRDGALVQVGTPAELYLRPADPFVAGFLGEVNRVPALLRGGVAESALGDVPAALPDGPAALLVRPEGVMVGGDGVAAEVEACRLLGSTSLVHLKVADGRGGVLHIHARLPPGRMPARGDAVRLAIDPARAFVFPAAPA